LPAVVSSFEPAGNFVLEVKVARALASAGLYCEQTGRPCHPRALSSFARIFSMRRLEVVSLSPRKLDYFPVGLDRDALGNEVFRIMSASEVPSLYSLWLRLVRIAGFISGLPRAA